MCGELDGTMKDVQGIRKQKSYNNNNNNNNNNKNIPRETRVLKMIRLTDIVTQDVCLVTCSAL